MRQVIVENSNFYLLLDTAVLKEKAYVPLAADSIEFTAAKSIADLIADVDQFTRKEWLWHGSMWDEYEQEGPILVEAETDSQWEFICIYMEEGPIEAHPEVTYVTYQQAMACKQAQSQDN